MSAIRGRAVWITGASSGIGKALAVECFARGASLVLSARDESKLKALHDSLLSGVIPGELERGQEIIVKPLDLSRPGEAAQAAVAVLAEIGHVDMLICAAGVSQRGSASDTGGPVVRRIMEINFFGAVELTRAVLPSMLASGTGHIVVITSAFGKFGASGRSSYAASKHALHGFFDSLRVELPRDRVRITLIVPGWIATDISAKALNAEGAPSNHTDEMVARGMSPAKCARKIVRAILHDRAEVFVAFGPMLRLVLILKQVAPRLLTWSLRKWAAR